MRRAASKVDLNIRKTLRLLFPVMTESTNNISKVTRRHFLQRVTIGGVTLLLPAPRSTSLFGADTSQTVPPRLPFVLDMVHHNPGEAKTRTMFLDPALLKSWGFNGDVPREFVQCAVTFDSFDKDIFPAGGKERAWVEENARQIDALVKTMKESGLPCYPFTDFIV